MLTPKFCNNDMNGLILLFNKKEVSIHKKETPEVSYFQHSILAATLPIEMISLRVFTLQYNVKQGNARIFRA